MSESFMPGNEPFRVGDRVCHYGSPEVVNTVTSCDPGIVMKHRYYMKTKESEDKKMGWIPVDGWSIYKEQS